METFSLVDVLKKATIGRMINVIHSGTIKIGENHVRKLKTRVNVSGIKIKCFI